MYHELLYRYAIRQASIAMMSADGLSRSAAETPEDEADISMAGRRAGMVYRAWRDVVSDMARQ